MSLRGKVLWYQPREGQGILETECGQEFSFTQADDSLHLQGGDIVEFSASGDNQNLSAHDIRLVQRCIDNLIAHHEPLADLFHQTVGIQPGASGRSSPAST